MQIQKKKRKKKAPKYYGKLSVHRYLNPWLVTRMDRDKNPAVSSFTRHKWQDRWTFTIFAREGRGYLVDLKFNSKD